eukprot:5147054-Pyramimonas_sp.AAC.1
MGPPRGPPMDPKGSPLRPLRAPRAPEHQGFLWGQPKGPEGPPGVHHDISHGSCGGRRRLTPPLKGPPSDQPKGHQQGLRGGPPRDRPRDRQGHPRGLPEHSVGSFEVP